MSLPVSIGDCIEILKAAKAAYDAVKGVDDSIKDAGHTIQLALAFVQGLQTTLSKRKLSPESRNVVDAMITYIKKISKTATEIQGLLKAFKDKIGPGGLEIRFAIINKMWFAGTKASKMRDLLEDLNKWRRDVADGVNLLTFMAQGNRTGSDPALGKQLTTQAQTSLIKRDLSIIFLDADNTGRSKVAQGYAKLVREWTRQKRQHWPIKSIWSAGFNVSRRNELVDILTAQLGQKMIPSSDVHLTNPVASRVLFENKLFSYPTKPKIRTELEESQSRGLRKDLFKEYDYLIVFSWRGKKQLESLKKAILEKHGEDMLPTTGSEKGKIVLLSNFGGKDQRSIRDGGTDEKQWKVIVPRIKMCLKAWLTEELGWETPT